MKRSNERNIAAVLVVLLAALVYVPSAHGFGVGYGWAGDPSGDKANGLALSSNAPGTKLYGVVEVEYGNTDTLSGYARTLSAVLRLRMGGVGPFVLYSGEIAAGGGLWNGDIMVDAIIQDVLTTVFTPKILAAFFGQYANCPDLQKVHLKNATEGSVYDECSDPTDSNGDGVCDIITRRYQVMDVEFAVETANCPK